MKSRVKSSAKSNDAEARACLSASNNSYASWSQINGMFVWRRHKNPWAFIAYSGTKQWRNLALPWRLYSWCRVCGGGRSRITWTWKGPTIIPLWDMVNLSRQPAWTQKLHFREFKWILYLQHHKNTYCKSFICCACFGDRAVRSSRYTKMMWIKLWKQYVMAHWKVAPAFLRPKGMTRYVNVPHKVVNDIL